MAKKSRLAALFTARCPRCRTGSIFSHSIFSTKFSATREHCPCCGVKYESEPGFFWGAMYFSYALGVALLIIMGLVIYGIYDKPPLLETASFMVGVFVLFIPFNNRISRLLFIYLAAPYKNYVPGSNKNCP
jgi:uncharacterized protein (DUF983 family)